MSNEILSDETVNELENKWARISTWPVGYPNDEDLIALLASHRAQARRLKELEDKILDWKNGGLFSTDRLIYVADLIQLERCGGDDE